MSYAIIGVVKYYLINDILLVGDNSSVDSNGITDTSYSGEIIIPENVNQKNVKEIGYRALIKCSFITKVRIYAKITCIHENAFWGCDKLEYINIPSTVIFIGWGAICFTTKYDLPMLIEFNKGRTKNVFINAYGFSRKKFTIIYPSSLEPLYYKDGVTSPTICAFKSFLFCNKFQTTINMSECPSSQFKWTDDKCVSIASGMNFRSYVIVYSIIILLC